MIGEPPRGINNCMDAAVLRQAVSQPLGQGRPAGENPRSAGDLAVVHTLSLSPTASSFGTQFEIYSTRQSTVPTPSTRTVVRGTFYLFWQG